METTKRRSSKKLIIILVIVAALIIAPFVPTLVCEIMTAVHLDEFVSAIEDYDETVAFGYKYKVISYGIHYAKVYRYTTGDNKYGICLGEVMNFHLKDSRWRYDNYQDDEDPLNDADYDVWDTMWSANGSADRVVWQYWWHIVYEYGHSFRSDNNNEALQSESITTESIQNETHADTDRRTESADGERLYFPEPNERSGGYMADFADGAFSPTVKELFARSDIVILANVINEDQWISDPSELETAESTVTASKVYKGGVAENDIVTVRETGYRFDDHDVSFGGEPILRKGMKVVLFLTGEDPDNDSRGIVGCFQGKVFLDQNDVCYPYSYYTEYDREHGGNTVTCPFFEDFKEPIGLSDLEKKLR